MFEINKRILKLAAENVLQFKARNYKTRNITKTTITLMNISMNK